MNLSYRYLSDTADLDQVEKLQHLIWGDSAENLIGLNVLFSLARNGCPIIGAFDGALLVGFSVGFFGLNFLDSSRPAIANLKLASKRLGVHPDYRSNGIAYQLKTLQYQFAKDQGLQVVTWTFDPLNSRNAYLHLRKLAAVARQFVPDYYGEGADRMIAEWWVNSNRVEERLFGSRKPLPLQRYLEGNAPLMNPSQVGEYDTSLPVEGSFMLGEHHLLLVEIPADVEALSAEVGKSWRIHSRAIFEQVFMAGYIATDFLSESYEGRQRSFYVFGFDGSHLR